MEINKVIINVCLTGMVPTKQQNPKVPITTTEIIKSALACGDLGAAIVHIHARDQEGKPTWKKEVFAKIISGIREKNDKLLISVSTSGRLWSEFEKRSQCLELKGDLRPDLASLTVGSMNFITQESVNNPEMIERLALKMKEKGIKPEMEVFEPGMVHKAKYLIGKGIIEDKAPYFNILLGSLGTSPLNVSVLGAFLSLLPNNAIWSLAGIGQFQLNATTLALALGGNIRIGLEDNIYFDRMKKVLATNEQLLERVVAIAKLMKLETATSKEAKFILKI